MAVEIPQEVFDQAVGTASWLVPALIGGASTAGIGGGVFLAIKGILALRQAKKLHDQLQQKPTEGANAKDAPFPRKLDEARELRRMATAVEGRIPEYDAAVGRQLEEQLNVYRATMSPEVVATVEEFWNQVKARADKLMPHSTREYR